MRFDWRANEEETDETREVPRCYCGVEKRLLTYVIESSEVLVALLLSFS